MSRVRIHIIHVGNMANKGTQALLISDVFVINEVTAGKVDLSVSATDVDGVKRLGLPLKVVLPSMVDIPYERADSNAKRLGLGRESVRYKVSAILSFFYMFLQVALTLVSVAFVKVGLEGPYRSRVLKEIKAADMVVSCSDENFKESASMLPMNVYWILTWWSMLIARTVEVLVVKLFGKPIVMFPNTVGPFRTAFGRMLSKLALNSCGLVLVREQTSYDILKSLGVRSQRVLTSDTTLLLNGCIRPSVERISGSTVGVSPGIYSYAASEKTIQDYILAHAEALDIAIEKHGFSVVFLPHYITGFRYDDLEISKLILLKMKNSDKAKIIEVKDARDFGSLIKTLSLMISSKMHPAVLAASFGVPFLYVAYDYKQTGFAASVSMDNCVIPFDEVTCERLVEEIDEVWNERQKIRVSLMNQIPQIRAQVRQTIRAALKSYITRDQ